ncbi:hypothetical protein LKV13_01160 [Borrelia sp. BU AG58]|uniref:hypothetical protein n=1 Tax=Borrelia sp. BU AG58 TaxID=2887345 RepID=UPI001E3AE2AA|nr:hypothetical protein [Borrelia sp. BU AG58]UER67425.1 hypothetical protein LKV13_01160 [Borrelia sp. BU AG58]
MSELYFYVIRLFFIFVFNVGFSVFYIYLYKDMFVVFVFCLILINIFVMISYLRYYYDIEFKNDSVLYKSLYSKLNFDFSDILWIKKRLLDNMLILGLSNGRKIKICFLRNKYLIKFFMKLKSTRNDLFVVKAQEFPIRYYVSGIYLATLSFRILISFFIYYISLSNIVIFLCIFFIDIRVLARDILAMKDLVIFYEFKESSVFQRKLFARKEYFYKFFHNVSFHSPGLSTDGCLSFVYDDNSEKRKRLDRIFISDKGMSYSMQSSFAYVYEHCSKVT